MTKDWDNPRPQTMTDTANVAVSTGDQGAPNAAPNNIALLTTICDEIFQRWDKDMRSGKLLLALSGHLPSYRADVTAVRRALAVHEDMLAALKLAFNALDGGHLPGNTKLGDDAYDAACTAIDRAEGRL